MEDTAIAEAASDRLNQYLAAIEQVKPGVVCTPDIVEVIATLFEASSGLQRDQFLMSPFGFPPVPIPSEPSADGTGRCPTNVNVDFVRHPVYWLDWDVAERRPDEDDWTWHLRLYIELAERGWWDVDSGDWYDVAADFGIDVEEDPAARERLAAYAAGTPDAGLNAISAVAPDDYESRAAEYAENMVAQLTPRYEAAIVEQQQEQIAAAEQARTVLEPRAEFDPLAAPVIQALQQFQASARHGTPGVDEWGQVTAAAQATFGAVADMFQAVVVLAVPAVHTEAMSHAEAAEMVEQMAIAAAAQRADMERIWLSMLAVIRDEPLTDSRYADAVGYLRTLHQEAWGRYLAVLSQTGQAVVATGHADEAPQVSPEAFPDLGLGDSLDPTQMYRDAV